MASKAISSTKLTDSLTLSWCTDGYWLYDYTRGMNLAMCAKTEQEAFIKALAYYQKRCEDVEQKNKNYMNSINSFIESLSDNDEIEMPCDCNNDY